jgi:Bacterial membrane protein YfhO
MRAYFLIPPALLTEPAPIPARLRAETGLARVVTPFEIGDRRWPELTQVEAGYRWVARTGGEAWNVAGRFGNLQAYTGMLPRRLDALRRQVPMRELVGPSALWGFEFVTVLRSLDLAASAGMAPPYDVVAKDPELPAFLVRRPARPRAVLAGPLTSVDEAGALAFVASPGAAASGRSVVEASVPAGYRPPIGEARVTADDGERVEVTVSADGPALLVLNDQVAPGWTAQVDGRPAEIHAANYLARGVWVEAGQHRVVFRYSTPGLAAGLAIALVTAGAVAAWAVLKRRRRLH